MSGPAGSFEPGLELVRVEAEQAALLEVRDAVFGHEAADVAVVDAQPLGDGGQVEERDGPLDGLRHSDLQTQVLTALGPSARSHLSQTQLNRRSP